MKHSTLLCIAGIMSQAFGVLPASAEQFAVGSLNFEIVDNEAMVVYSPEAEGDIVVPSSVVYNGAQYAVTALGENALSNSGITSVILPSTMRVLGTWSLNSTQIASIELPEGLESIGEGAFQYCSNLTSITFPSTLKSIGDYGFNSTGLTEVVLPDGLESVGTSCFQDLYSLQSVTVPGTVKTIGNNAFANNWNLSSVTLGEGIEEIGMYAFSGAQGVTELNLPKTLKKIGVGAFDQMQLTSLTIPGSVISIGDWAFGGCYTPLEFLTFEDGEEPLETTQSSFQYYPVKKLYVGRTLTMPISLDPTYLEEITTGGGCKSIQGYNYSYALTSLNFHEGLEEIGKDSFSMCVLDELVIPSTVTAIGENCFTQIHDYTNDKGMTTLTFADGDAPLSIGDYSFTSTDPKDIYVGRQLEVSEYFTAIGMYGTETITFGGGCRSISNFQFLSDCKKITVLEGVERIENRGFDQSGGVEVVTLPSTLKYIGDEAFHYCQNLRDINFPEAVTYIGEETFYCTAITEAVLPESLETLGAGAFYGCAALKKVSLAPGIPSVGFCTFLGCTSLEELNIPSTVTFMDNSAVGGCTALVNLSIDDSDLPLQLGSMGPFAGSPMTNLYLGRNINGGWFSQTRLENLTVGGTCSDVSGFGEADLLKTVTLGENVRQITSGAFAKSAGITDVIVASEEPATLADDAFAAEVYENALLTVPEHTFRTYSHAEGWKLFRNISGPEYLVSVTCSEGGHARINGLDIESDIFAKDTEVIITVIPDLKYRVSEVTLNGMPVELEDEDRLTISAIDADAEITITFEEGVGVGNVNSEDRGININGRTIVVTGAEGNLTVSTVDGKVIYSGLNTPVEVPAAGIYIVNVDGTSVKITVR